MRSISTQSILVWLSIPQNWFSQHLFSIFNYLNITLRFSLVQSSIVIILLTLVLFLFIWYTVGTSQISFYQCAGCVCVCFLETSGGKQDRTTFSSSLSQLPHTFIVLPTLPIHSITMVIGFGGLHYCCCLSRPCDIRPVLIMLTGTLLSDSGFPHWGFSSRHCSF